MKLTLTQYDKTYTIETKHDDMTLTQVIEECLIPLLLAAGFDPKAVSDAFGEDDAE